MIRLQAAFTFTGPVSDTQIQQIGQDVALLSELHIRHLHVGIAGSWVVLLAHLEQVSADRAQLWLTHLLQALEAEQDITELFRVEIDQMAPQQMTCPS